MYYIFVSAGWGSTNLKAAWNARFSESDKRDYRGMNTWTYGLQEDQQEGDKGERGYKTSEHPGIKYSDKIKKKKFRYRGKLYFKLASRN